MPTNSTPTQSGSVTFYRDLSDLLALVDEARTERDRYRRTLEELWMPIEDLRRLPVAEMTPAIDAILEEIRVALDGPGAPF